MICASHHNACDCREQRITTLNKAALDAAFELMAISNIIDSVAHDEKLKLEDLISRIYAASEALGPEPTTTKWPQLRSSLKEGANL